jgi:tRNA U34 5-methylaminomethyl-2-thiouridine-forming methyltransferase MnmC
MDPKALSFQHPETQEWAHDSRDPLKEALCTYLKPAWESLPPDHAPILRLLEIGFGRGLNTAMALSKLAAINFPGEIEAWGCEPNPDFLPPWPTPPEGLQKYVPWWGETILEKPRVHLLAQPSARVEVHRKTAVELMEVLPESQIHWIFLDLFSPARHPQDWEPQLFSALARVAEPEAVLTSYCCARRVRDGLQTAGWECEIIRRPHYRDTLRARFLASEGENA